jgi:hypothetical protein
MGRGMRRREFISLVGGATIIPLVVRAQQTSIPVVGILGATTAQGYAAQLAAFRQGLNEAGLVEGRDAVIEYRWRMTNTIGSRDWPLILSAVAWL